MTVDLPQLSLWLTLAGTFIGVTFAGVRIAMRVGVLEFKVATMWNFQMRRGFSEVVNTGVGTLNSPLHFTDDAIERMTPIRDELVFFGATALKGVGDGDALLLIESAFGDKLLKFVCVPCGLSHGACLLLAFTIATGRSEIRLTPPRGAGRVRKFFRKQADAAMGCSSE